MKYLRNMLLVALALLVAFSAAAQKKTTVRFMCTEADLPKAFVDKFNAANPDIELLRQEEDWTKFMLDAGAGTASDLMRLTSGTDIAYYAQRGLLYDMTKLMQGGKLVKMDDIDILGSSGWQYDGKNFGKGKWYGLPKDFSNIGCLTYNKEMFKAAGIAPLSETVPITYFDELYNLGKKLTKKDSKGKVQTWGFEFYSTLWTTFMVSDMATAQGLSLYADSTRSSMNNDPKVRDLWKYWTRFPMEDISSNMRNPNLGWAGDAFQSDRSAITQLGYWFGAQMQSNDNYGTRYGWAPTPIVRKGSPRSTTTMGATGIAMYSKTKVAKEAFRVWEWYMAGDYGIDRARTGWGIPALKSLVKLLPEDNDFNRIRKRIALDDGKYFKPWQFSPYVTWTQYMPSYTANIDDLVKGSLTTDQFIDKFYAGLNDTLATGRAEVGE